MLLCFHAFELARASYLVSFHHSRLAHRYASSLSCDNFSDEVVKIQSFFSLCLSRRLQDIFDQFDESGDGLISIKEMGNVFLMMGVQLSEDALLAVFK